MGTKASNPDKRRYSLVKAIRTIVEWETDQGYLEDDAEAVSAELDGELTRAEFSRATRFIIFLGDIKRNREPSHESPLRDRNVGVHGVRTVRVSRSPISSEEPEMNDDFDWVDLVVLPVDAVVGPCPVCGASEGSQCSTAEGVEYSCLVHQQRLCDWC